MGTNDDIYAKELNLNYFYMHSNSEQKYPKTAIVNWVTFCGPILSVQWNCYMNQEI